MLYFMNNGIIEPKALMTFGVSAKLDESAIGYFGTGFKYAVAVILRGGGVVRIESGGDVYVFTTSTFEHRGKTFENVLMNGEEMNFTTALGRNWLPWMAYRELYCNAVDEKGIVGRKRSRKYETAVLVEWDALEDVHTKRHEFIYSGTPIASAKNVDIIKRQGQNMFFKGIAVLEIATPMLFGYNLRDGVTLTEDRTARYNWEVEWEICNAIQRLEDPELLRTILSAPSDTYEGQMSYTVDHPTSESFLDMARTLLKTDTLNESARKMLELNDHKVGNWEELTLTPVQKKMYAKAREVLLVIDIDPEEFPVNFVKNLGKGVMGRAYEGEIYLSPTPFELGTKQVASTLMEEWVHTKFGHNDFDRGMQNWLFDKILSLSEAMSGEPI